MAHDAVLLYRLFYFLFQLFGIFGMHTQKFGILFDAADMFFRIAHDLIKGGIME